MKLGTGVALTNLTTRGGGASVAPLRTAVTQNRIHNSTVFAFASTDTCCLYWPFVIGMDCESLVLSHSNFYVNTSLVETNTGNSLECVSSAFIRPADSAVFPIFYGANRNLAIADGAVDLCSNEVTGPFYKGEVIWAKLQMRVPVPGITSFVPYNQNLRPSDVTGTQCAWYDSSVATVSSTDAVGIYTITGGSFTNNNSFGYRPQIWGRPLGEDKSFIAIGNSIAANSNDTIASVSASYRVHGCGYMQRATHDGAGSDLIPMLNIARAGHTAVAFAAAVKQKAFYQYGRFANIEPGVNDLGSTATLAKYNALVAAIQTVWADVKAAGVEKILAFPILPRISLSTDDFTTVANQTISTGYNTGEYSQQYNTFLASKVTDGTVDALADCDAVRDGTNPLKWIVNGTINYATSDGLHPSPTMHDFIAAAIRSVMRGF